MPILFDLFLEIRAEILKKHFVGLLEDLKTSKGHELTLSSTYECSYKSMKNQQ